MLECWVLGLLPTLQHNDQVYKRGRAASVLGSGLIEVESDAGGHVRRASAFLSRDRRGWAYCSRLQISSGAMFVVTIA